MQQVLKKNTHKKGSYYLIKLKKKLSYNLTTGSQPTTEQI